MKLIPPFCHKDTPNSERKVFEALRNDKNPLTQNWIVYHSLNYPVSINKSKKVSFKYYGESDFLILAQDIGIINIEVKGGAVKCADGVWSTKGKNKEEKTLNKSPIKQAHDTKYNIQDHLQKRFGKKFPQEYLVIFPDCDIDSNNIEYSLNNIINSNEFYSIFSQKIINITKHLKPGGDILSLTKSDIIKLKDVIRPDFETFIKKTTLLKDSDEEIYKYTKNQLRVLDSLGKEPRVLVTGSQGTGKTAMAEQVISRFANSEKKILFINSGRLANIITKLKFTQNFNNIKFTTFNKLIREINRYYNVDIINAPKEFISSNNYLTTQAFKILNEKNEDFFKYDLIIIDEMQHCYFYDNFYLLIDKILNKGLLEGNYYFFGDFEYQNIIGEQLNNKDVLESRKPKDNLQSYEGIRLWDNVRNSGDIAYEAPIISGIIDELPLPYSANETVGRIKHFFCKNKEEKQSRLLNILKELKEENINGNDIVILSNYKRENSKNILNSFQINKYYNLFDLSHLWEDVDNKEFNKANKDKNTVYFSTALAFQGLESKIVIYIDPLESIDQNRSLGGVTSDAAHLTFFNAMGRANTFLYVLWDKQFEPWYDKRLRLLGKLTSQNEN